MKDYASNFALNCERLRCATTFYSFQCYMLLHHVFGYLSHNSFIYWLHQNSISCGTAILFRNCLSRCPACNCNRSIARLNLSFFCFNCFIFICSAVPNVPPTAPKLFPLTRDCGLEPVGVRCESSLPCCSSYLATRLCSLLSSLSRYVETRPSRLLTSGVISFKSDDCATWRECSGISSKCCVC